MAKYTYTQAAGLLTTSSQTNLVTRIEMALLTKAAARIGSVVDPSAELGFIQQLKINPGNIAASVTPLVLTNIDVASPGADPAYNQPTDAELTTAINTLWNYFYK